MKIIRNDIIPFKGFKALYFFGLLFVRKGVELAEWVINHERIHERQAREMLYVGFYLWYIVEWLIRLCIQGRDAYHNISFEREARANQYNNDYLATRRAWAWIKYI